MTQSDGRKCLCGNPYPMVIRVGVNGEFYSCTDKSCRLGQSVNSKPLEHPGSTPAYKPQPNLEALDREAKIITHSRQSGFNMRKAWHERHNIPFPEAAQGPILHK